MSLATRLLSANPGAQVSNALTGSLTTPGAKGAFQDGDYQSIATVYLSSADSSSAVFTSIPQTFAHLEIRWVGKDDRGAASDSVLFAINGDTTTANYTMARTYGDGSQNNSQAYTSARGVGSINGTSTGNYFGAAVVRIMDYASSNKKKQIFSLTANDVSGGGEVGQYSIFWNSSSAITSLTLTPENGTVFKRYSRFALYGIKG